MGPAQNKAAVPVEGIAAIPVGERPGFHQRRRQDSRDRIIQAALALFFKDGYIGVSVEDIAAAAGVSRMTYYRQFPSKAALAVELFEEAAKESIPRFLSIGQAEYHSSETVRGWIAGLFAADRLNRGLLRIFTHATGEGAEFTDRAQTMIADLIVGLGATVPAFAVQAENPQDRRRWLEAWLLIYEILDQSNHAALASGIATDPLVVDIIADRFMRFIEQGRVRE